MTVEGLAGDAEFGAEFAEFGAGLASSTRLAFGPLWALIRLRRTYWGRIHGGN